MGYDTEESGLSGDPDPLPAYSEPDVEISNRQRRFRFDSKALHRFVRALLEQSGHSNDALHVTLLRDPAMREVNRDTFGKDKTTNVISFPLGGMPGETATLLGDVIVSVDTAAREAQEAGMSLDRRLAELIIHGYLHILGYEHVGVDAAQRKRMRRAEKYTYARLEPWVEGRFVKRSDDER